ncbi:MBL fold metallo-hydrolase [Mangrovivirga sp. M17]|uniref:MBL fold metallo-hydrolase n=1 Tax=Mangrovivirga halotolerans TaxID=2993936 RepID=A0ABT3RNK8_9BACT|nr:MBL fold metallo-hydrolase [Mangrovivirga halotolerans]MCX2743190.1 MBL fold metallo-hydrolase [Mangrovivirga halotolerans]
MKTVTSLFLILLVLSINAQEKLQTDQIETKKGILTINPVQHATMVLEWNNKTIYVDPHGGKNKFKSYPDPDIILITDIHGDHFNKETLNELPTSNAIFIVPPAVNEKMNGISNQEIITLKNGSKTKVDDMIIQGVPMYNLPETADSRHPKGRGNGYLLTMGGKKIYISGDTEDIPEMRSLKNVDIAFVCMNLPYTMSVEQAANAVLQFKPDIVYPYHYRGQNGYSDVNQFKALVEGGVAGVDVRLLEWYK